MNKYSEVIPQQTTTVNLKGVSPPNIYNHITETLYDRFDGYRIKINHAGKTVKVELSAE